MEAESVQDPEISDQANLETHIGLWLERVWDDDLDPSEEAERVVREAPELLKPLLRAELADLMQFAQSAVLRTRLREGSDVDKYTLGTIIGTGSTGTVWEAHTKEGQSVALKFLHPSYISSPDGARRVMGEARAAARVQHPGLVPILDQVHQPDLCALVSPLIGTGTTLATEINAASHGTTEYQALSTLKNLMVAIEGTAAMHEAGVYHLDLKPGNLVRSHDGQFLVTDMGLAKIADQPTMTRSSQLVGTPAYMSPELASGNRADADARSDVWAWGVILFEVVALHRPFAGAGMHEVLRLVIEHVPNALYDQSRSLNRDQLSSLRSIVYRCLEKDPASRYPNAAGIARDMHALLEGKPVVGVSWVRKTVLGLQRNRRALIAILIATLITAPSIYGVTYYRSVQHLTEELTESLHDAISLLGDDFDQHRGQLKPLIARLQTLTQDPRLGDPVVRAGILAMLANSIAKEPQASVDEWRAVRDLGTQALALLPEDEREARASLHLQRAFLHTSLGQYTASRADYLQAALNLRGNDDPLLQAKRAWAIGRYQMLHYMYAAAREMHPALRDVDGAALLRNAIASLESQGIRGWALRCEQGLIQLESRRRPPIPSDGEAAARISAEFEDLLGFTHRWTTAALSSEGQLWYSIAEAYPQVIYTKETVPDPKERAAKSRVDMMHYYRLSLEAYEKLLERTTLRYGPDHVFSSVGVIAVGQQLMLLGDPEAGRPYYERGIATRSRLAGPNTEQLLRIKTGYGVCLIRSNQFEDAVKHYENHWKDCADHPNLGPGHPVTIIAHRGYQESLAQLGQARAQREDAIIQWEGASRNLTSSRPYIVADLRRSIGNEMMFGPDPQTVQRIEDRWLKIQDSWRHDPQDDRHRADWITEMKSPIIAGMERLRAVSAMDEEALLRWYEGDTGTREALYLMGLGRIHFLRADRIGVARVLSMADAADLQSVREFMVADLALLDHLAGNSKPAEELLTTYSHEIDFTNNDPRTRLLWFLRHR